MGAQNCVAIAISYKIEINNDLLHSKELFLLGSSNSLVVFSCSESRLLDSPSDMRKWGDTETSQTMYHKYDMLRYV